MFPLPVGWRRERSSSQPSPPSTAGQFIPQLTQTLLSFRVSAFPGRKPPGKGREQRGCKNPMMGAPPRQGELQSLLQRSRSSHHSTRRISALQIISLQLQDQGIYAPLQVLKKICQQPLTLIQLPPGSGSSSSGTASSKHFQRMQSTFQTKSREFAALPAPAAAAGSKKEQAAGSANTHNPCRLQPYKVQELLRPLKHQEKKN